MSKDLNSKKPKIGVVPKMEFYRGRLGVIQLEPYISGEQPIKVRQEPNRHPWLSIQDEDSPGGLKIIGIPPVEPTESYEVIEDKSILVTIVAENEYGTDTRDINITLKKESKNGLLADIKNIKRVEGVKSEINFGAFFQNCGEHRLSFSKGSESTWLRHQIGTIFFGYTPFLECGEVERVESNVLIAEKDGQVIEIPFTIQILKKDEEKKEMTTYEKVKWDETVLNAFESVVEGGVTFDLEAIKEEDGNIRVRFKNVEDRIAPNAKISADDIKDLIDKKIEEALNLIGYMKTNNGYTQMRVS